MEPLSRTKQCIRLHVCLVRAMFHYLHQSISLSRLPISCLIWTGLRQQIIPTDCFQPVIYFSSCNVTVKSPGCHPSPWSPLPRHSQCPWINIESDTGEVCVRRAVLCHRLSARWLPAEGIVTGLLHLDQDQWATRLMGSLPSKNIRPLTPPHILDHWGMPH